MDATPTLVAGSNYFCTGQSFTPSVTVNPRWYISTYTPVFTTACVGTNYYYPFSTLNTNQQMNWLTPTQYSAMNSYSTPAASYPRFELAPYATFIANNGIPNSNWALEGSHYAYPQGGSLVVLDPSNHYKASVALFCNGETAVTSTPSAYSQTGAYTGAAPSFTPITLSQAGAYTFKSSLKVNGCIEATRTYLNYVSGCDPTYNKEMVYLYKNSQWPYTFESAGVPITVEDPFDCNTDVLIFDKTFSPSNPAAGSTISYSFKVKNNFNHPIKINVAHASSGQFQNFQISPVFGSNYVTIAAGQTLTVSGTAVVKLTATPPFTFKLQVLIKTESADCSGSIVECPPKFIENTFGAGYAISCSGPASLSPGQSGTVSATCSQSGAAGICPPLTWSVVPGTCGTLVPTTTPANPNPQSILTISPTAATGQTCTVTMTCQNPATCTASCNTNINIVPQDSYTLHCYFENNHGPVFFRGESEWVAAECTQGGNQVPCPIINWQTNVVQGSLNPLQTTTPSRSLFSVGAAAPAPQTGRSITATCATPAQCENACDVEIDIYETPTSCSLAVLPPHDPVYFLPTDSATIRATCFKANGQATGCPGFDWISSIPSTGFNPNPTQSALAPETLFSTQGSPEMTGYVQATSNLQTLDLLCAKTIIVDDAYGPDYIVNTLVRNQSTATNGEKVKFTATIKNQGNVAVPASTVSMVLMNGLHCTAQQSTIPGLGIGAISNSMDFTCTCVSGDQDVFYPVNVYADSNNDIAESNEANNAKSDGFVCKGTGTLPNTPCTNCCPFYV